MEHLDYSFFDTSAVVLPNVIKFLRILTKSLVDIIIGQHESLVVFLGNAMKEVGLFTNTADNDFDVNDTKLWLQCYKKCNQQRRNHKFRVLSPGIGATLLNYENILENATNMLFKCILVPRFERELQKKKNEEQKTVKEKWTL